MLTKEKIIELLNGLDEHKMAKEVFVPVLKNMNLKGVKFTGGPDEQGIDIEYYEFTQPENHKSYVGIQFKKNDLVYSSGGGKSSVKEVQNQAEDAFLKEIVDIDSHSTVYISRFIVAVTGIINEPARKMIGKVRQKALDRRIDYWDGDRLSEYIQNFWMLEFEQYFNVNSSDDDMSENIESSAIDSQYIKENYKNLLNKCSKVRAALTSSEWDIIYAIIKLSVFESSSSLKVIKGVQVSDLLEELGHNEDYYDNEFRHLRNLGYIEYDDCDLSLNKTACYLYDLAGKICNELFDAGEDISGAEDIFNELF